MEFTNPTPLPLVPDDQTIPQLMLEYALPTLDRPHRPNDVPALINDETGQRISLEEIKSRAFKLASALRRRYNIGDNDVVCIYSPNDVDYPVAIWAAHMLGAVVSPANPGYTVAELQNQLITSKSTLILTQPQLMKTASQAAHLSDITSYRILSFKRGSAVCLDDLIASESGHSDNFTSKRFKPGEGKTKLAFLCFSSGTTGKPKAVAISHYNVIANVIQKVVHILHSKSAEPEPVMPVGGVATGVLPFFHIYGLVVGLHFAIFAGMTVVVIPRFSFLPFLDSIVKYRITHLFLVPPHIVLLCKHPAVKGLDLSYIRLVLSGAAPLSAELTEQLKQLLPNSRIAQGYGATEATGTITMFSPSRKVATLGSAGQLVPGIKARVIKADGSLGGVGEQGELVISGPNIALRYVNDEKSSMETFVDGWVHTGDEVIIDQNNEIFVVDRRKEILKVKGFQVAPAELEGHLLDHPDVADACVVSVLDDFSGELPLAYVVLEENSRKRVASDAAEADKIKMNIIKHVESAKVQYKWLTGGVRIIDAIPKSPSGKILRKTLRDKAREEQRKAGVRTREKARL